MSFDEVAKKVDELNEKFIGVWENVCNIESPTEYKEGVDRVASYFEDLAKDYGFKAERVPMEKSGDVLVLTLNPDSAGEPISMSGHMDTVHSVGSFGTPAVTMDDTKIYGPGVADCKGGIVTGFLAMAALSEAGFTSRPVKLLLQSDEENNSMSSGGATIDYICKKAQGSKAFLNLECCRDPHGTTACLARKGIGRYKFIITGISAHASLCAKSGANAILDAAYRIIDIEKFKNHEGITCSCGVINGGTLSNVVPESCEFLVDVRFSTEKQLEEIDAILKEIAQREYVKGCSCTVEMMSTRICMELKDRNIQLLESINKAIGRVGYPPLKMLSLTGGSDAAYASAAGIPSVDSIGIIGENLHSRDEWGLLSSLADSAKKLAAIIMYL